MLRIIANPGLRALMLFLLLAQASLPAQAGKLALPAAQNSAAQNSATQNSAAQTDSCSEIPFGTPFDREMSRGKTHCYTFTLKAGQFAQAVVEQHGIDVV